MDLGQTAAWLMPVRSEAAGACGWSLRALSGRRAPNHAKERVNASARAATGEGPGGTAATALAGVALSANVLYVSMYATDQGSLVSSIAAWLLSRAAKLPR